MRYHTTGSLSEHIHETPEGYLLCQGACIARIGVQEYLPDEVPDIDPGGKDVVLVYRGEDDLFSPETIASYEGKSVTLDHPDDEENDDFVTPANFRELARGHAQNVRRGEGEEADLLLADLLIMEAEAIAAVRGGLRALSCGYDADYEQTSPGVGRQCNITGNHIALVDRARGGHRCKINDKDTVMTNKPKEKNGWLDRLFGNPKVRKALDEAASELAAKDNQPPANQPAKDGDQPQAVTDNGDITAKLDEVLLMLRSFIEAKQGAAADNQAAPAADNEAEPQKDSEEEKTADNEAEAQKDNEPVKTGDRAAGRSMRTADAATVRRAKSLAPLVSARVGDSYAAVVKASLRSALGDPALAAPINSILSGKTLDSADSVSLNAAFLAASELAKARNNGKTADSLSRASVKDFGKAVSPADINAANRAFHTHGGK